MSKTHTWSITIEATPRGFNYSIKPLRLGGFCPTADSLASVLAQTVKAYAELPGLVDPELPSQP